jgi:hypothetical protein
MRSSGAAWFAIITTYRESELNRSHPLADITAASHSRMRSSAKLCTAS